MKSKKIISVCLSFILILLGSVPVFAEYPELAESVVESTYTVTIPTSIQNGVTNTVSVEDAVIPIEKELNVAATYSGKLSYPAKEGVSLSYNLKNSENKVLSSGDNVATVVAFIENSATEEITVDLVDTPVYAGSYTDDVTFSVSVDDHIYTDEEIASTPYLEPVGLTAASDVIGLYNEEYTEVYLFQNGTNDGKIADYSVVDGEGGVKTSSSPFVQKGTVEKVSFENGITELGDNLFAYANTLEEVTNLPNTLTTVGQGCFRLTNITALPAFPDSLTAIESCAFYKTKLETVNITANITAIGNGAFSGNRSDAVSVLTVDADNVAFAAVDNCLYSKDMKELYTVESHLTSYITPNTVETVHRLACVSSFVQSVVLSEGLTTIERDGIVNCPSLTSVTLPSTLASYSCVEDGNIHPSVWNCPNAVLSFSGECPNYEISDNLVVEK